MAKKLYFSATDAQTLAASDYVGSYLFGASGQITSGSGAADNIATSFQGIDARAFGYAFDGTDWDRLRATSGALNVSDGGGALTVDASQLDIDDLNATDDAVQAWAFDGTGNAIGSTGGSLNVNVSNAITVNDVALANSSVVATATALSGTEAALPTLASRKYLNIYNHGSHFGFLGPTGVADTDGFPVAPGVYLEFRAGASIALYGICLTGKTTDMRSLEFA